MNRITGQWSALITICVGVVCVLTTWFSATAIIPELIKEWRLSTSQAAWLTNSVQIGFVTGAIGSSLVNLPDIVRLPRLMAVSALGSAIVNGLLLIAPSTEVALVLRFLTGVFLAGVYPAALKVMATWFVKGRGLAMGVLIAALTLGSSAPHLFRALVGSIQWQYVVVGTSAFTLLGAMLFLTQVKEGPNAFSQAVFQPRHSLQVLTSKPLFLANLGYFGHMWELYAMWAWILAFTNAASLELRAVPFGSASVFCFIVIASGCIGCILGGILSDRYGRCYTTMGMMFLSGICAFLIGFFFDGPVWLFTIVAVIWGVTVIGDSAQFSAAVTELADSSFVGTALALQLGIGFALTVVAISIVPEFVSWLGSWQWAFLILIPGPLIGVISMAFLRLSPESHRLADGAK